MNSQLMKNVVEAALMVANKPLSIDRLIALFAPDMEEPPDRDVIRAILDELKQDYAERGVELRQVASGYRVQARGELSQWMNRLWEERSPRYSRALLETMAIIAYKQPVTRGEIEAIRGVAVSTGIIRTLLEREWIRVAGRRDVPGRPAVYTTTRQFLDYFNLKSLSELPTLAEIRESGDVQLELLDGGASMDRAMPPRAEPVSHDDNQQEADSSVAAEVATPQVAVAHGTRGR